MSNFKSFMWMFVAAAVIFIAAVKDARDSKAETTGAAVEAPLSVTVPIIVAKLPRQKNQIVAYQFTTTDKRQKSVMVQTCTVIVDSTMNVTPSSSDFSTTSISCVVH